VPAKDVFHDAVRHALEKEQWIITNDPLFFRFGGVDMYIDLAAEPEEEAIAKWQKQTSIDK